MLDLAAAGRRHDVPPAAPACGSLAAALVDDPEPARAWRTARFPRRRLARRERRRVGPFFRMEGWRLR